MSRRMTGAGDETAILKNIKGSYIDSVFYFIFPLTSNTGTKETLALHQDVSCIEDILHYLRTGD